MASGSDRPDDAAARPTSTSATPRTAPADAPRTSGRNLAATRSSLAASIVTTPAPKRRAAPDKARSRPMVPAASTSGLSLSSTATRSEEHTSELQSLMRISYAVFCLKKKKKQKNNTNQRHTKINNTTSAQISTIKRKYTKHITHKNRTTTYTLDNTPTKNINSKNLSKQRYRKHSNT